jgi:hypothetical protein
MTIEDTNVLLEVLTRDPGLARPVGRATGSLGRVPPIIFPKVEVIAPEASL